MTQPPLDEAVWDARVRAALSGPFIPATLLDDLDAEPIQLARIATRLAHDCDVAAPRDRWVMRAPARRYVLETLAATGLLNDAIVRRKSETFDEETRDLLSVLSDRPPLATDVIQATVEARKDRDLLKRIVTALDRAGSAAPAHPWLVPARSALAVMDRLDRRLAIEALGFFGRKAERARARAWLAAPPKRGPLQCLLITGGPGLGKSALLEAVVRERPDPDSLVLRLDFDRAGMDVLDRLGLTIEAARQIGEQLGLEGTALIDARLQALSELDVASALEARRLTPRALATHLATSVGRRGVIVVVDTLEVLRGRGESHIESLFTWLEDLHAFGLQRFHVVAAGRGEVLERDSTRVGDRVRLDVLESSDVEALFDHVGLSLSLRPVVGNLGDGHPLKLRLAIEIARRSEDGLNVLATRRHISAAYLYRFLLSRISDPDLVRLAYPGLIVRRLSSDVLRRVIAPAVRLADPGPERVLALFNDLTAQHWLVEEDGGLSGYLRHRADMRSVLLPLLYRSQPAASTRLDRRAADYFERLGEPWARLEALYHRLQLLRRRGEPAPDVAPDLAAQFDEDMIGELPAAAQDLIRRARGERTTVFRTAEPETASDQRIMGDLLSVIEKRDWREGDYILDHLTRVGFEPWSEVADAVRALYWRSGRWALAKRSLADRDRARRGDEDLPSLHPQLALVRLEMRAELRPKDIASLSRLIDAHANWVDMASASPDGVGRAGALAFLLHAPESDWRFRRARSAEVDILGAFTERWARAARDTYALEQAMDRAARRSRTWLSVRPEGASLGDGRLLASLTPYETPARNWLALAPDSRNLLNRTQSLCDRLLAIGGLLVPGDTLQAGSSKDPVSAVADMGLLAEWVQAAAFFWRSEDLRLIGTSAERWRRTAAGDWAFAAEPPDGWPGRPLDETLLDRLRVLEGARDPVEAALSELAAWALLRRSGHADLGHEGERLALRIHEALPSSERTLITSSGSDPMAIMKRLQVRRVPSAFLPALSIVLGRDFIERNSKS